MMHNASILFVILLLFLQAEQTEAGEKEFEELIEKMEDDVLELAREAEELYKNRCDDTSLEQCYKGNYKNCVSELPGQQCIGGEDYAQPACGKGEVCSSLWDYTTSVVRLPDDLTDRYSNPRDNQVIETVCFTQALDEYLTDKHDANIDYWDKIDVPPPWFHYGAHNGVFRIYPGRQTRSCGGYDPRQRPWYIAASSGPKNVILILDTSGSMRGLRLELMKQAAKQVINSLTVGDRVAVVEFGSRATLHADRSRYLYEANVVNKKILIKAIDMFYPSGLTNFLDAFQKAFRVLDNSIQEELHVPCNTAILFLTDGKMTAPEDTTESAVVNFITDSLIEYEEKLNNRPILLFTYSVSADDDVHVFPKEIACSATGTGVWSKIVDDREIFESLTSYFLLFAVGLGVDKNENFTAWVEPYEFATGGLLGTTVSAPVYDRSKDPPLFLGVAGLDFPMAAVDKALDVEEGSQESINHIVLTSTAKCPDIDLTLCELESFRRRGSAGNEALCTNNCSATEFVEIEEEPCPAVSDYPGDLWADRSYEDLSYLERTCCKVGEDRPSDECPLEDGGASTAAIVGGVVGGLVGVIALCLGGIYCVRRRKVDEGAVSADNAGRKETAMSRFDNLAATKTNVNAATAGQLAEPDIPVPVTSASAAAASSFGTTPQYAYSSPVFTDTPVPPPLPPPSAPPADNPNYVASDESGFNP